MANASTIFKSLRESYKDKHFHKWCVTSAHFASAEDDILYKVYIMINILFYVLTVLGYLAIESLVKAYMVESVIDIAYLIAGVGCAWLVGKCQSAIMVCKLDKDFRKQVGPSENLLKVYVDVVKLYNAETASALQNIDRK